MTADATPPATGPQATTGRLVFLDVLRLIAALQMVQGHTLDALLSRELRTGRAFQLWTFARGLTSTTFLVCAGLAFALAVRAGSLRGRAHRVRRASTLVVVGYAMHAPLGALFGQPWSEAWRAALVVDVLQCIGVTLLLLEALSALIASRTALAWASGALGGSCFVAGVWSDTLAGEGFPLLSNYLGTRGGSLFPLLPWSGFVCWGTSIGLTTLPVLRAGHVTRAAGRLAAWGSAMLTLGLFGTMVMSLGPARVSPGYACLRLGLVLLVAALLVRMLEGRWSLPSVLRELAGQTLFLYVSHVLVLYAGVFGLATLVGPRLPLGSALSIALLLLMVCSAGALGYRRCVQALRGEKGGGTPRANSSPLKSSR